MNSFRKYLSSRLKNIPSLIIKFFSEHTQFHRNHIFFIKSKYCVSVRRNAFEGAMTWPWGTLRGLLCVYQLLSPGS